MATSSRVGDAQESSLTRRWGGLAAGALLFALALWLPPPAGMSPEAWRVAAVAGLMAVWWITEALPLPATALLPLVLFPLLGVAEVKDAAAPYANPLIFLFMGGFVLGLALQRWNLHRRIALGIVARVGTRPASLVGGFMLATAFLSLWVSNTATAVMMLPVALSVIGLIEERAGDDAGHGRRRFAISLLLGVAYGASIGGLGTLIGTPPNALLAGYLGEAHGMSIGFAQWMALGVPLSLLMLALAWWLLTHVLFRVDGEALAGAEGVIGDEIRALGPMSHPERLVAIVFAATALAWIARPLAESVIPGLDDTVIAIAAALALFLIPSGVDGRALMDWDTAKGLPWGVLLLFGGGLTLAAAIASSGLAVWLGEVLKGLEALPGVVIVLAATVGVIFLTELTSNTATAAAFLPLVGSVAVGIGMSPVLLTVPVALAASCAFMLPVATPPNAIVYGSGHLAIPDMVKAGLWLNLAGSVLIVALTYAFAGWLFPLPGAAAGG